MLIRIAWLDVLIILLPVALFFLGSQLTQSLGKSMLLAFLRTLYVQFVQVLSLTLGFSLFNSFVNGLGPDQKFMYLAVACANVYLTIRIPGFMDIASGKGSLLTEAATTVVGTYTGAWKSLSKPKGK
jgi:hypothetical protein